MPVDLAYDDSSFDTELFSQIVAQEFFSCFVVDKARIGVRYLTEVLISFFCIVDSGCERDLPDIVRNLCQIDDNLLVIAIL